MIHKNRLAQLGLTVGGVQVEAPNSVPDATKAGYLGSNLIHLGITLLLITAAVLSLGFIIWGGIQWILSAGDKHSVEQARMKIIYAVIGLVVSLSAFFILSIVGGIFGIDFTTVMSK
jgi:uncharacterized membrane protein YidH (DUF202 family)